MPLGIEKAALMGGGGSAGVDYTPTKNNTIGGYAGVGYMFRNDVYNPTANTWLSATSYSQGGWTGIMAVAESWDGESMISYAISVRKRESSANGGTGISKKYTDSSNAWAALASISTTDAQWTSSAFLDGKSIFASGINSSGNIMGAVSSYDTAADTYTAKSAIGTPRQFCTCMGSQTARGGTMFMVGGSTTSGSAVTALNEKWVQSTNTWSSISASTSYERQFAMTSGAGDYIFQVGGHTGSTAFQTDNRRYDPGADSWSAKTAVPTGVQNAWGYGTTKSDVAYYYLSGGSLSGTDNSTTSREYSNISDSWDSKTAHPNGARWNP